MTSYYWNKFLKWVNTPKADRRWKIPLIAFAAFLLLCAGVAAFAGDRACGTCPAPTTPTPTPTTTTTTTYETKSDSHSGRNFVIMALVIAGVACAVSWEECGTVFTGGSAPAAKADPNPGSIVPVTANPSQYNIQTEVQFHAK